MSNYFKDKKIFLTGASSGIGKDLTELLRSQGAKVGAVARNRDKMVQALGEDSPQLLILTADVTNELQMKAAAEQFLNHWGVPDIVIANAGLAGFNPAYNFSPQIDRQIFETSYFGMIHTFVPFMPAMLQERKGHLVAISSLAAFRGLPNVSSYSASKRAQATFLESWRVDLKRYGIPVTSIHPGFVKTAMTEHDEFWMPFMVDVRVSSQLILKAIEKKKSTYCYPGPMRWLTYLNRILPNKIYDWFLPLANKSYETKKEPKIF